MKYIITEEQYGQLSEMIKLDIKVGDTLLGGKFKNKKVVVKTIGQNEKGDITINGKPLLRFRILKEEHVVRGEKYQKKWRHFYLFMKRREEEIKDLVVRFCDDYRDDLNTVKAKFVVQSIIDEVIENLLMKNTIHDEQIIDWVGFYVEDNFTDLINNELGLSTKQEQTEGELTEKCWKGYTQKGMKTMFGKRYPNCVKKTK